MNNKMKGIKYFNTPADPPYRGSTREAFGQALEFGGSFALPGEGPEGRGPGILVTLYEYRRTNPGQIYKRRVLTREGGALEWGALVSDFDWLEGEELEQLRTCLRLIGWLAEG